MLYICIFLLIFCQKIIDLSEKSKLILNLWIFSDHSQMDHQWSISAPSLSCKGEDTLAHISHPRNKCPGKLKSLPAVSNLCWHHYNQAHFQILHTSACCILLRPEPGEMSAFQTEFRQPSSLIRNLPGWCCLVISRWKFCCSRESVFCGQLLS